MERASSLTGGSASERHITENNLVKNTEAYRNFNCSDVHCMVDNIVDKNGDANPKYPSGFFTAPASTWRTIVSRIGYERLTGRGYS